MNYNAYINSQAWRDKRQEFFAKAGERGKCCFMCKRPRAPGFHVHHLTYARLGHELVSDLALVCEPCHDRIHINRKTERKLPARVKKRPGKIERLQKAKAKRKERKKQKRHEQAKANKRRDMAKELSVQHHADLAGLIDHFSQI